MGKSLSRKENEKRRDSFEEELKEMNIQFIKIVGSYGSKENSYILLNVDENFAKEILGYNGYNQESFIVGECNGKGTDYYYWQKEEGDSDYDLLDAERGITMMDDAEDFFSSKKMWKFKIDFSIFRESRDRIYKQIIRESANQNIADDYNEELKNCKTSDDVISLVKDFYDNPSIDGEVKTKRGNNTINSFFRTKNREKVEYICDSDTDTRCCQVENLYKYIYFRVF